MDIRGSGNLLGEEQSGTLRAVGVDLFQDMLRQAIEAITAGREPEEPWTPRITLGMPVLIDDRYVPDLDERMSLYRAIAALETADAAKAFAAQLAKRYGPVPPEVRTLLGLGELKRLCRETGVEQIDVGPRGALLTFRREPEGLKAFLKRQAQRAARKMAGWRSPGRRWRRPCRSGTEDTGRAADRAEGAGTRLNHPVLNQPAKAVTKCR